MFQKLFFSVLMFISIVLLSFDGLCAQEQEEEIIIVSERVGEEIDLEGRKEYNLFPAIKGFQPAISVKLPNRKLSNRTYLLRINDVENKERTGVKPPLDAGRIVGEVLVGGVLGFGGGYLGLRIAFYQAGNIYGPHLVVPLLVGMTIGSSLGVYSIGTVGNETGSYGATFLGSVVATGMAIMLITAVEKNSPSEWIGWIGLFTLPTLGGVMGFNLTRRYETSPVPETAFINFRDSQMSLGIPTISFRLNPFDKGNFIQSVELVKVEF